MRVLLVEDETQLRSQLVGRLQQAGYGVNAAVDGREGVYLGSEYQADVGVIDLGLPYLTGIEVIRKLRALGKSFPILILTARGRWQDKVEGLEAGADDYLVKPFAMEELLARLKALVRRAAGWTQSVLCCEPIVLNLDTQTVSVLHIPVELTSYEYKILQHLMLHAGQIISKTVLTEQLYDQDFDRDSNVIEVLVGRLRRKLDPNNQINPIETLRGRGYRFILPRC